MSFIVETQRCEYHSNYKEKDFFKELSDLLVSYTKEDETFDKECQSENLLKGLYWNAELEIYINVYISKILTICNSCGFS